MAQAEKTVSVIIPTHNRPELLKRAITSVERQTYRDFELIVIEDREGRGGGWARNQGIKQARGKFIAFLDDDDEWMPEKLEVQMAAFSKTPPDVGFCFSAVRNVTDDRVFNTTIPEGISDYFERVLERFKTFLNVTLIIKREVFDAVGMFDERFPSHQEADLMVRVAKRYRGLGINRPLVRVNMTTHEQTGGNLARRIAGRKMILKKYWREYIKRPRILWAHLRQIAIWYRDGLRISSLVLLCAGVVAGLVLGEFLVRSVAPTDPSLPDPVLGQRMNPKLARWDANGFRDASIPERADIIALGDNIFERSGQDTPDPLRDFLRRERRLRGEFFLFRGVL